MENQFKHPEMITNENLITILDDYDLYNVFFRHLKKGEPIDQAIWYTLKNKRTDKSVDIEKKTF